jgi:bifunctional DNase/RNase
MSIYGVSFDMVGKQPIVLLKTDTGNRFLPIWIGHPEAAAILMKLQGASTPRPMTHDLLSEMLSQLDAKCERVSVTELRDNTFYASITISMNGSEIEIDSRPSDALALAVRTDAPIYAAEDVIEESSIEFEHEVEDTEEVVEKFKDFLDEVSPEDFASEKERLFGFPRVLRGAMAVAIRDTDVDRGREPSFRFVADEEAPGAAR